MLTIFSFLFMANKPPISQKPANSVTRTTSLNYGRSSNYSNYQLANKNLNDQYGIAGTDNRRTASAPTLPIITSNIHSSLDFPIGPFTKSSLEQPKSASQRCETKNFQFDFQCFLERESIFSFGGIEAMPGLPPSSTPLKGPLANSLVGSFYHPHLMDEIACGVPTVNSDHYKIYLHHLYCIRMLGIGCQRKLI